MAHGNITADYTYVIATAEPGYETGTGPISVPKTLRSVPVVSPIRLSPKSWLKRQAYALGARKYEQWRMESERSDESFTPDPEDFADWAREAFHGAYEGQDRAMRFALPFLIEGFNDSLESNGWPNTRRGNAYDRMSNGYV
jgi:hypothetical protein